MPSLPGFVFSVFGVSFSVMCYLGHYPGGSALGLLIALIGLVLLVAKEQ